MAQIQPWLLVLGLVAFCDSALAQIQYGYDAAGRLVQVVAPDGSSAVYQYDAAGNIISIQNVPAGQLNLVTLSTTTGSSGAQITIQGSGFSTNCASDAVSFNGLPATVVSCTANQLVVQVPSGAVSGPVAVTVGNQVVSSTQPFVVLPGPTISSFAPGLVNVGAAVTVTGTNLDPLLGSTQLTVGGLGVNPTSLSATQVTFAAQQSGTIVISTPNGLSSSASELLVLPQAIPASGVMSTAVLAVNAPAQSLSISQTGSYGLFSFDATQGQFLTLQLDSFSTGGGTSLSYQVYSPTAQLISSGAVSASTMSIHLPQIPSAGTYLVVFASGGVTVQLSAHLELDTILSLTGTPASVATVAASQSERLVFNGAAGQSLGVGLTGLTLSAGSAANVTASAYQPDGTLFYTWNCNSTDPGGGCTLNLQNLSQTGTYTVLVVPVGQQTMSFTATASQAVTGALTPGTPLSVNLSVPGQYAWLTFTVSAGQILPLTVDSIVTTPAAQSVTIYLFSSGGGGTLGSTATGQTFNLNNLAPGTYTLMILPSYAATATLQVFQPAPQILAMDGSSTSISTSTPGQSAFLTFSATAGQSLSIGLTGLTLSAGGSTTVTAYVYEPDGTLFYAFSCDSTSPGGGCTLNLQNLPKTGTYTVQIVPAGQQTMSFTASSSQAVTGTLTPGTPLSVNLSVPGQYAWLTFTVGAGQILPLTVGSIVTTPAGQSVTVYLFTSGGAGALGSTATGQTFNLNNLAPGTYTLMILPSYAATATLQVFLPVSQSLAMDGSSLNVSTGAPGDSASFTFSATAGQSLGVGLTGLTLSAGAPTTTVTAYVYEPSGTLFYAFICDSTSPGGGCTLNLQNLPQTGNYTVLVEPAGQQTMSFTVSSSQAVTGTLVPDTPLSVNLSVPGQYAWLTFTVSAGQILPLTVSSIVTTPVGQNVTVYLFSSGGGETLGSTATGQTFNLNNLAPGTYTLMILPSYAATATLQVVLPAPRGLAMDGSSLNVSTSVPGESASFFFSATAGQSLGAGLTGLTLSAGASTTVTAYVYNPDGTLYYAFNCDSTNPGGGCTLNLQNLPESGTYTVLVEPAGQQTMSFSVSSSQPVTGTLVPGTPLTMILSVPGQYAWLTLTPGDWQWQTLTLAIYSIVTAPPSQSVSLYLFSSGGAGLLGSAASDQSFNLNNLTPGVTYTLMVLPNYAATATAQIELVPPTIIKTGSGQ